MLFSDQFFARRTVYSTGQADMLEWSSSISARPVRLYEEYSKIVCFEGRGINPERLYGVWRYQSSFSQSGRGFISLSTACRVEKATAKLLLRIRPSKSLGMARLISE